MKKTVLIVDDLPDMRYVVRMYLEPVGYEVTEAGSRMEAVQMMMENPTFNLVITDNDVPERNEGLEVIKQARLILPRTSVVWLMSAEMTSTKAHTAIALGANKALDKSRGLLNELVGLMEQSVKSLVQDQVPA